MIEQRKERRYPKTLQNVMSLISALGKWEESPQLLVFSSQKDVGGRETLVSAETKLLLEGQLTPHSKYLRKDEKSVQIQG